ncbi:MAG: hypothetical protein AAGG06_00095 [Pseudomonadota bacterium]
MTGKSITVVLHLWRNLRSDISDLRTGVARVGRHIGKIRKAMVMLGNATYAVQVTEARGDRLDEITARKRRLAALEARE